MKEAIGNSLLFYIVVIFVTLVILFFVGILAYSKAYKVKNRIIEILERYESYSSSAIEEINVDLKNMGYSSSFSNKCGLQNLNNTSYKYCLYEKKNDDGSYYYKVVTYVHFDFPFIGSYLTFPVNGETKNLGKKYNYE